VLLSTGLHPPTQLPDTMELSDESKQLNSHAKFPLVKELFLNLNTVIPSSAPVEEQLVSASSPILTVRRSRLT